MSEPRYTQLVCVGLTWGDGADSAGDTGVGANCAVSGTGGKTAIRGKQSTLLLCPGEGGKSGTWGVVRRVLASS